MRRIVQKGLGKDNRPAKRSVDRAHRNIVPGHLDKDLVVTRAVTRAVDPPATILEPFDMQTAVFLGCAARSTPYVPCSAWTLALHNRRDASNDRQVSPGETNRRRGRLGIRGRWQPASDAHAKGHECFRGSDRPQRVAALATNRSFTTDAVLAADEQAGVGAGTALGRQRGSWRHLARGTKAIRGGSHECLLAGGLRRVFATALRLVAPAVVRRSWRHWRLRSSGGPRATPSFVG